MPDVNQLAHAIVAKATKQTPPEPETPAKNPAAVALGKLGGAKGGNARAANMSPKARSAAARKAVKARWAKVQKTR